MVDTRMSFSYSSYSYNNISFTPLDPADAPDAGQAENVEKPMSPQEIMGIVFEKMLNEEVAGDPEWAKIAAKLAEQGPQVVQMELDNFGVDFTELAANPEPDMFFPASMVRAQQELAAAVLELATCTMGVEFTHKSVLQSVESAPWQESVIQYALNINSSHIVIPKPEENGQPISQDIKTEFKGGAMPMMGAFSVKSMLTTTSRPAGADRPRPTNNPKAPPPVNFANYKSADLHGQFVAKKASTQPKAETVEIKHSSSDININLARAACSKFASFLGECAANGVPTNIQALIQWVLRQAYMDGLEQLVYTRDKVDLANQGKKLLRDQAKAARAEQTRIATEAIEKAKANTVEKYKNDRVAAKDSYTQQAKEETKWDYDEDYNYVERNLTEAEQAAWVNSKMSDWDKNHPAPSSRDIEKEIDKQKDELTDVNCYALDLNANPPKMVATNKSCQSKAELEDYIADLENKLSSLEDDAQLMNTDLQSTLQKQQELMNTLSNLGKLFHDTAMAIIRKIG